MIYDLNGYDSFLWIVDDHVNLCHLPAPVSCCIPGSFPVHHKSCRPRISSDIDILPGADVRRHLWVNPRAYELHAHNNSQFDHPLNF